MSFPFNQQSGLILVNAVIEGPSGDVKCCLVLDSGATGTIVSDAILLTAGYDPSLALQHIQVTTASGVMSAPRLPVRKLSALGHDRLVFPVVAHTVPTTSQIHGLLGLDFLRGLTLRIDFRTGLIDLT
jgi:predicted aspartyl protease